MKIRRIDAINLNSSLGDLVISNISKDARKSIITTKIALTNSTEEFEKYRKECVEECKGDEVLQKEMVEDYLLDEVDIDINQISSEEMDNLLDKNELRLIIVECLYKFMVANVDKN